MKMGEQVKKEKRMAGCLGGSEAVFVCGHRVDG